MHDCMCLMFVGHRFQRPVRSWLVVGGAILVILAFHAWLVGTRWINPDEGAHLMDARLALEGLVPNVDFNARQPLYVYSYVPSFLLFGPSLVSGRLVPLLATWLTAFVIFLIGRRLWDRTHGGIAALLFLVAPTVLINAPVTKMEPLAMAVTAVGMYFVSGYMKSGRSSSLWQAGAAFGGAYYVRESTVAGALAAIVLLLAMSGESRVRARRVAAMGGGMAIVCLGMLLWYSAYLPWPELLRDEGLFPPCRVWTTLEEIGGSGRTIAGDVPPGAVDAAPDMLKGLRKSPQSLSATVAAVIATAKMNAPLLLGAIMACIWLMYGTYVSGWRRPFSVDRNALGVVFVVMWLAGFAALYGYYALKRGFFQFYFRELIPPMALLTSWVISGALKELGHIGRHVTWVAGILWVFLLGFLVQTCAGPNGIALAVTVAGGLGLLLIWPKFATGWGRMRYGTGIVVAVGVSLWMRSAWDLGSMEEMLEWTILGFAVGWLAWFTRYVVGSASVREWMAFGALAFLCGTAAGTCAYATGRVGRSFDCVWSPEVLTEVVSLIKGNSAPEDTILSGAVIWEFESGRRPFAMLTHPLALRDSLRDAVPEKVYHALAADPPRLIVVDGYTEQTYFRRLPLIETMLPRDYVLLAEIKGPGRPVQVYRRVDARVEMR